MKHKISKVVLGASIFIVLLILQGCMSTTKASNDDFKYTGVNTDPQAAANAVATIDASKSQRKLTETQAQIMLENSRGPEWQRDEISRITSEIQIARARAVETGEQAISAEAEAEQANLVCQRTETEAQAAEESAKQLEQEAEKNRLEVKKTEQATMAANTSDERLLVMSTLPNLRTLANNKTSAAQDSRKKANLAKEEARQAKISAEMKAVTARLSRKTADFWTKKVKELEEQRDRLLSQKPSAPVPNTSLSVSSLGQDKEDEYRLAVVNESNFDLSITIRPRMSSSISLELRRGQSRVIYVPGGEYEYEARRISDGVHETSGTKIVNDVRNDQDVPGIGKVDAELVFIPR